MPGVKPSKKKGFTWFFCRFYPHSFYFGFYRFTPEIDFTPYLNTNSCDGYKILSGSRRTAQPCHVVANKVAALIINI